MGLEDLEVAVYFMLFKEIIGQEAIKKRLIQSVKDNRISHAQLFLGSEGSGTLALAIAYAQYISCINKHEFDACGKCKSCVKYNKLVHPDLFFIYPVNKTTKVDEKHPVSDHFIQEWREAIIENPYLTLNDWYEIIDIQNKQGFISTEESKEIIKKLILKPYESDYKIMLIWHPEKMHIMASNKLLKILEEPPENTIFLLITDNSSQMLPTIISRTQIVKINKLSDDDISNARQIADNKNLTRQEINQIVFLADGNYNYALKLVNESYNKNFNQFQQWMRLCYGGKFGDKTYTVVDLIDWVNEFSGETRETQKNFFTYSLQMFRESLMMTLNQSRYLSGQGENNLIHLTGQEEAFLKKFSHFINYKNIYQITDEINKAISHIERNVNSKILLLDLSLKIKKLLKIS